MGKKPRIQAAHPSSVSENVAPSAKGKDEYGMSRSLFHILLATRTCAVLFSNIWDCDETYNYFEPSHFLLYGYGAQTWEYSPEFSLRSYAYLWSVLSTIYVPAVILGLSKVIVFYLIRFVLVIAESWALLKFVRGISSRFGPSLADWTLLLAAFAPGYFQATSSFLPSSSAMVLIELAFAFFLEKKYLRTALCGAVSVVLIWPFSGALYLPLAFAVLFILKLNSFMFALRLIFCAAIFVIAPVIAIDSLFYGKFVFAAFNIFSYNVAAVDEHRGSHLYGTAPISFYLLNLFLNFNVAMAMACIGIFSGTFLPSRCFVATEYIKTAKMPSLVLVSTLLVWLAVFFPQAHKEERFLYPVYPLICVISAIGIETITSLVISLFRNMRDLKVVVLDTFHLAFILVFSLLSLSRCASLYFNYHASMDVHLKFTETVLLPSDVSQFNYCVGREWHRVPSHFMLNDRRLRIRFVESGFKGHLPGFYFENMTIANATRAQRNDFNDLNKEEPSHYTNVSDCHFMVDLDMESSKEVNYASDQSDQWVALVRLPYLADVDREQVDLPAWKSVASRVLRAFYVPYFSNLFTSSSFRDYVILQNTNIIPLNITNV